MRPGRALLGLWCALSCPGCLTFNGTRAVVPFFEVYEGPASMAGPGRAAATDAGDEPPVSREYVLRPLGSIELIGEERKRLKAVWPLFDWAGGGGYDRLWVLPFLFYRDRAVPELYDSDVDFMIFPFVYAGYEPGEGRYFGVLPFGGVLRGLLGKRKITFILFPLYWRAWEASGFDSLHIVWPFYQRSRGGGMRGWRIWPFWGGHSAEDSQGNPRYRRHFVMWPFYISQENRLNSATPSTLFFSFPFYGRDQTPRTDTTTYLWPFFHRIRDKQNGDVTYAGYLFPYRFGPDQKDFWPFFGWKRTREVLTALPILERRADADDPLRGEYRTFRQFALWPIQRYQHEVSSFSESHRFWFLPFFWRFHRLERFPEREVSEWKVWPLLRYRRDGPTASFYFPSPLWFRQESLFERQWARLWRLYLYESNETRSGWEVLWGLFSHRHEKTVGSHTWSILYGLFEWETAEDGTSFRLFYLPWK